MASLSVFKWAFPKKKEKKKKKGSQPLADLTTQMRQRGWGVGAAVNTWKSPALLHTKVDQVSVEPTVEVQQGLHLFIYLFFLNVSEMLTQELEEGPQDRSPKK